VVAFAVVVVVGGGPEPPNDTEFDVTPFITRYSVYGALS
jgi:hypothetical protein